MTIKRPIIVTAQKPKYPRRPKPKQTVAIAAVVVQARKPDKRRDVLPDDAPADPEADARVKAFFARMIRPRNA
jgi:hypothetical protein